MKPLAFLFIKTFIGCLIVAACNSPGKDSTHQSESNETTAVGSETDEHGCKASAGYQWSVVKNECIRVFEAGIRLDPQAEGLDKTTSAFILFKSDDEDSQAELYLPSESKSILLEKIKEEGAGTWKNDAYTLSHWKGMYTLADAQQKILYQGPVVSAK